MNIREAKLEDLAAMLEIYNEAVTTLTATFDLVPQSLAKREVWFNKYGDTYPLIVAEVDGEIAGYCGISAFNQKAAYAKTVELSIYLSSKHRGQGIGRNLLGEIIDRAKALEFHTIIAMITEGNEASVKLHETFGFEFAGKLKEVGSKFGQWQNVLYYQLMLDE